MEENISKKLCKRCGRELKDNKSKILGFGPVCYKKQLKSESVYLFDFPVNKFEKQVNKILNSMTSEELYNLLKKNGLIEEE